jgi:hypothetical protein
VSGAALFGDQVMAMITVTWTNGINSQSATPGYEFNMALAVLALVIVFLGPGRFSVDAIIEKGLNASRLATRPPRGARHTIVTQPQHPRDVDVPPPGTDEAPNNEGA